VTASAVAAGRRRKAALRVVPRLRRLRRVPRRGVGVPGRRRHAPVREDLPRGLPIGAVVVDDPAEARGIPPRFRRVQLS
jgi:hypothetical protein